MTPRVDLLGGVLGGGLGVVAAIGIAAGNVDQSKVSSGDGGCRCRCCCRRWFDTVVVERLDTWTVFASDGSGVTACDWVCLAAAVLLAFFCWRRRCAALWLILAQVMGGGTWILDAGVVEVTGKMAVVASCNVAITGKVAVGA